MSALLFAAGSMKMTRRDRPLIARVNIPFIRADLEDAA
jgi:hypothetical protein